MTRARMPHPSSRASRPRTVGPCQRVRRRFQPIVGRSAAAATILDRRTTSVMSGVSISASSGRDPSSREEIATTSRRSGHDQGHRARDPGRSCRWPVPGAGLPRRRAACIVLQTFLAGRDLSGRRPHLAGLGEVHHGCSCSCTIRSGERHSGPPGPGRLDRSENFLHRWLARPAEPDKKSAEMVSARWSQPRQVDGRWQGQIQVTNASSVPILATTVRTPLAGDVDLGAASRESKSSETARLPDGKPPPLHVELHDTRWRLTDGRLELLEPEEARANRVAQLQRANVRRFLLGGAAALSVLAYISPRFRPRWRSRPRRPPRPPTLGPRQQSPWRRRW